MKRRFCSLKTRNWKSKCLLISYDNFIDVLNRLKEKGLTPTNKQKIIVSLIDRIEVFPDRLDIYFAIGRDKIKKELAFAGSLFNFQNVLIEGSTSLINGGRYRT
jgi:hypothetical protein